VSWTWERPFSTQVSRWRAPGLPPQLRGPSSSRVYGPGVREMVFIVLGPDTGPSGKLNTPQPLGIVNPFCFFRTSFFAYPPPHARCSTFPPIVFCRVLSPPGTPSPLTNRPSGFLRFGSPFFDRETLFPLLPLPPLNGLGDLPCPEVVKLMNFFLQATVWFFLGSLFSVFGSLFLMRDLQFFQFLSFYN